MSRELPMHGAWPMTGAKASSTRTAQAASAKQMVDDTRPTPRSNTRLLSIRLSGRRGPQSAQAVLDH